MMSTTSELISQAAAALSLARLFCPDTGQAGAAPRRPANRTARDGSLIRRLRGLAGRAAVWCERQAVLDRLARMSNRDLAGIGLRRSEICQAFDPEFAPERDARAEAGPRPGQPPAADAAASECSAALPTRSTGSDTPLQKFTSMMTTLITAVAVLGLLASTAVHAGEGNGEPFAFYPPGVAVTAAPAFAADIGSAAYPNLAGRPAWAVATDDRDALPATGSEGAVQTANSLPRGAMNGTVAVAHGHHLAAGWLARRS